MGNSLGNEKRIFTDENVLGVLQQVLRFLIAGVHRDEFDLLQMYDHAVFAEEHVSGRSWPEEPGVPSAECDTAGQGSPRRSDRSPLASTGDACPRPRTLKRSTIQTECNVKLNSKRNTDEQFFRHRFTLRVSFPYFTTYLNKHQAAICKRKKKKDKTQPDKQRRPEAVRVR